MTASRKTVYRLLQVAWVAIAIYLLWSMLQVSAQEDVLPAAYETENLVLLGLGLTLITFPSGLLWWLILLGLDEVFRLGLSEGGARAIVWEWVGAFVLGYFQWFWFVPWLLARWRKHGHTASDTQPGPNR
jgi:hypothetical protein